MGASEFSKPETALRNSHFEYTRSTDPHFHRRRAILARYPEVRSLFGHDPWQTIPVVCCFAGQLAIAHRFASRDESWILIGATALLIGAVLNHWLCMGIHEAAHDLFFRTPAANRALAMFANIPVLIPLAMSFRKYHLAHHAYLGIDTVDPDLPSSFEVLHIGNKPWKKVFWLLFSNIAYLLRAREKATPPTRLELFNLVLILSTDLAILYFLGLKGAGYLLMSSLIGLSFHPVAGHFIHEHYVFEEGQETNSYYGLLNLVNFNVGYHNEHHDLMNIPGSRLPRLRAMAPEFYDSMTSHNSWLKIMWAFALGTRTGLIHRIVRTERDFYAYRNGDEGDKPQHGLRRLRATRRG